MIDHSSESNVLAGLLGLRSEHKIRKGADPVARSRRLKIPVEDKVWVVLSVLSGEMSAAEAARRRAVSTASAGRVMTDL